MKAKPVVGTSTRLILLLTPLIGGCFQGSLATSTGPRPSGHRWSTQRRQQVHLGETVEFDFVLHDALRRFVSPAGVVDYCVATIGGTRREAAAGPHGHFNFSHTFDDVTAGNVIDVRVDAFWVRGGKDYVEISGQWFPTQTFAPQHDARVAGDSVRLTAYQSLVEFQLPRPADDLDPDTGVLRLRKPDGTTTSVYRKTAARHGFSLEQPEPTGYYRVWYEPRGTELAPTATTDVTFTIYDVGGGRHVKQLKLATP